MEMEWTHVADRLPGFDTPVLVTNGKDILVGQRVESWIRTKLDRPPWRWEACGVSGHEWEWEFSDFLTFDPVTHWMPLPEPPGSEIHAPEKHDGLYRCTECGIAIHPWRSAGGNWEDWRSRKVPGTGMCDHCKRSKLT